MKIEIEKLFYYIIFVLTTISVFFLNNNRRSDSNLFTLNLILTIFTFFFIVIIFERFCLKKIYISGVDKILFLLLVVFFIITFMVRRYISIHWVYLFTAYFVANSNKEISQRFKFFIGIGILISICLQFYLFSFEDRMILSYMDPNYSGFVIFLFFLFMYKNGFKKIAIFSIILGLLTLSRAFFLAVVIFIAINTKWLFLYSFIKKSKLYKVVPLALGIIFIPLIIGSLYLSIFTNTEFNKTTGSSRFVSLVDKSNEHRFLANKYFFEDLIDNPKDYLFGKNQEKYTIEVYQNTPHHSVYQVLLNYGILYGVVYLVVFFKLLNNFISYNNMAYILSITLYFLFLGGGLYGIQVVFLFFILKESKKVGTKNRFFYT